jgi:hypothetical protein
VANTLYTPEQAARSTLAALRYLTTLPRTVRQDFSQDFVPGVGNVVNIRNPISAGTARVYTEANRTARDAIVFDDLSQTTIPVTITDQVYKAVRLPDDFATFDLVSLEQQVLRPQAESVVDGVTAPLLTEMNAVARDASIPTLTTSNALDVLIAARAVLNARKVPMTDRYVALSPAAEAAFLNLDQLQKVNESGSDGVLREAILGRLMGFTIIADPGIDGATTETQTVTEGGSGLTSFTLTYAGQTTASIAAAATAATVQTRLEALSNIEAGDVAVTGDAGGPYTVTFDADLGNVAELTATPTGGSGTVTIATTASGQTGFGVAYHRDAFAHVTRPSRNPEGAAKSATVAQDGFALRWLQHYNPLQLEDQSVVDTFVGAETLDANRAVSFDMTA